MSIFEERKSAFENKFVHENYLEFKAVSRRNAMLASWLSEQLGADDHDAQTFRDDFLRLGMQVGHEEAILDNIQAALSDHGIEHSQRQIQRQVDQYLDFARSEVYQKG